MAKFVVRVYDVNGKEYLPPYFSVRYHKKGTDGEMGTVLLRLIPGAATDIPADDDTVSLTVGTQAPGFSGETFSVTKVGAKWTSDTPAARLSTQGDTVLVDVTDGTARLAPTIYIPPNEQIKTNPAALLCTPDGGWIYYAAYLNNPPIDLVTNPIQFKSDTPNSYPYTPKGSVQEQGLGSMIFLEYGYNTAALPVERGPRFLIGIWAPRVALGASPQVLIFYTPPTKADRFPSDSAGYPYSPFVGQPPAEGVQSAKAVQAYPYLAINYLLGAYKIIPQILAAGRNPIIIFPIRPTTTWGPFGTQTGTCRLVKEVIRFLYARQLVGGRAAPMAHLSLDAGRGSVVPPKGLLSDEIAPSSWTLTVSGFSNGIDKVLDLCTPRAIDADTYPPAVFASPEDVFVDSWREIWDIDGVADDGTGAKRHLETLQQWLKAGGRRRVRSYHSDSGMRTAPRSLVEPARIISHPSPPYKGIYVEEGTSADQQATWVHFSDPSLQNNNYDAHHTMPLVAPGHAAQFPLP